MLVVLAIILGLIAATIIFIVYKVNKFKNRIEDTVIDK
jgi:ammonia channel protein AmtB